MKNHATFVARNLSFNEYVIAFFRPLCNVLPENEVLKTFQLFFAPQISTLSFYRNKSKPIEKNFAPGVQSLTGSNWLFASFVTYQQLCSLSTQMRSKVSFSGEIMRISLELGKLSFPKPTNLKASRLGERLLLFMFLTTVGYTDKHR